MAGFEDGERYLAGMGWGGHLAAKRTHQGTASKESGNSAPQLQKTEFCQQPEGA